MKRERVNTGENYWYISSGVDGIFKVSKDKEDGQVEDEVRFNNYNYFTNEEDAELLTKKLNAVLHGAEVIEIPSEEEIFRAGFDNIPCWCKDGDSHQGVDCDICCVPDERKAFYNGVEWLKSKIVK